MPEVTFFEPLALRTLIATISSLRSSSAVGCLATPPTSSTGAAGAAVSVAAGAAPAAASFLGALSDLAGLSAAGATLAGASADVAASFLGAFLGADFSSAMVVDSYYSLALVTPMVLRGPLRVRALVLVRLPRTGRPRRWRMPR